MEHEKEYVWVLVIEHRHGTNISVHRTEEGLDQALWEYLKEWWPQDKPMPDDLSTAAADYFEWTGWEESYIAERVEVEE